MAKNQKEATISVSPCSKCASLGEFDNRGACPAGMDHSVNKSDPGPFHLHTKDHKELGTHGNYYRCRACAAIVDTSAGNVCSGGKSGEGKHDLTGDEMFIASKGQNLMTHPVTAAVCTTCGMLWLDDGKRVSKCAKGKGKGPHTKDKSKPLLVAS